MSRHGGEAGALTQTRFWAVVSFPSNEPEKRFSWEVRDQPTSDDPDGPVLKRGSCTAGWTAMADCLFALMTAIEEAKNVS